MRFRPSHRPPTVCTPQAALAALDAALDAATRSTVAPPPPPAIVYLYECLEYYAISSSMGCADAARAAQQARFAAKTAASLGGIAWSDCARHIARGARAWAPREFRKRCCTRMRTAVARGVAHLGTRHSNPPQLTTANSFS